MTLRQPREIVVRRRSVPLSDRGVLGGHLSTRSTERLPSDERVCVTQHGVQEEGIVDEEQRERGREEGSHPRLIHRGRSMEFQRASRGEDRLLNWRRASKGRRRPPCFSPLTRRGTPRSAHPDASNATSLLVGQSLTSDRGNGSARYSDCHFPACIRPALLFLRRLFSPTFNYFLRSSILATPLPVDVRDCQAIIHRWTNDRPERGRVNLVSASPLVKMLSIRN